MISFDTLLKIAINESKKSTYKQKVGCVIFSKNILISKGYNSASRYCKKIKEMYKAWPNSLHAEIDAILKARKNCKGATALIVRVNNNGEYRLAKPCKYCMLYLMHVGIKKIIYTTSTYPYLEELILGEEDEYI